MLGGTVQNLIAQVIWCPGFVHNLLYSSNSFVGLVWP